jgi:HD-GYP domain-containing protein (c-di-GMP phosphodiesterase class II)
LLPTFAERYEYLKLLDGKIGAETFGQSRYINQAFYQSPEWKHLRNEIIVRDLGCDLGLEGYEIMKRHGYNDTICEAILHHHENFDGSGYPDRLKGEEIPIEARIMALADVFDALMSKRSYKEEWSSDKTFEIIRQDTGVKFDPRLGKLFLSCRQELEEFYDRLHNENQHHDEVTV